MTTDQLILQRVQALPPEQQAEVLAFVEFLSYRARVLSPHFHPRHSPKGLWADLDLAISETTVAEARRVMWGSFPREVDE